MPKLTHAHTFCRGVVCVSLSFQSFQALRRLAEETNYRPQGRLCLNPTAQKDNRGVLVPTFRVEQFSEIVGYSNMADYAEHNLCELTVVKLC